MGRRVSDNVLQMKWSRTENDILIQYPRKVDGHYAFYSLGGPLETFLDEMERRGYDRNSFRLRITRCSTPESLR